MGKHEPIAALAGFAVLLLVIFGYYQVFKYAAKNGTSVAFIHIAIEKEIKEK